MTSRRENTGPVGLGTGLAEVGAPVLLLAGRVEPPTASQPASQVVRIV
jgi:hypothetical protein